MYPGVYVNRTLNLKRINYIGVDMDHTLIRYKSDHFEALAHKIMCEKLVAAKDYPKSILKLHFDFHRAIRGLVIDKNRGNLLKLSRHAAIRQSMHGLAPIDYSEQNRIYKSVYIDLKDQDYDKVDTTFSISFATLFAQLVEMKDSSKNGLPEYSKIAEDLNAVLDEAHRDGSLKNVVRENVQDYIIKDPDVVKGIERYLKHNKKFFILTNSDYSYLKLLLDYAINPYLKSGRTWQDIFEYIIVDARKPQFFYENRTFLKVDVSNGASADHNRKLVPGVYSGGCATVFTNDLGLDPDEILYIGDHIYGDIVRLKKDCAWRTALVVEELDREVRQIRKAGPLNKQISSLMIKKVPLEKQLDDLICKKIETGKSLDEKKIQGLLKKLGDIDKKISPLIRRQDKLFNAHWGEFMRTGIEESYFAYQVDRFACIYMARLSHMLNLSPRSYFRSSKRLLPHEVDAR